MKTFNLRKNLSEKLSRLLLLKQNSVQEANESGLHTTQSRQIYVGTILHTAQVREEFLPRDKNNRKCFPFSALLSKLNSIILGQYLIRNNMSIDIQDIIEIQEADPYLNGIRTQLRDSYETKSVNSHFVLHNNVLFRNDLVLGRPVLKH